MTCFAVEAFRKGSFFEVSELEDAAEDARSGLHGPASNHNVVRITVIRTGPCALVRLSPVCSHAASFEEMVIAPEHASQHGKARCRYEAVVGPTATSPTALGLRAPLMLRSRRAPLGP